MIVVYLIVNFYSFINFVIVCTTFVKRPYRLFLTKNHLNEIKLKPSLYFRQPVHVSQRHLQSNIITVKIC